MKIVVLDGYTLNPGDLHWDSITKLGDCKIYDFTRKEDVIKRIDDAEIIFTNKVVIDQDVVVFYLISTFGIKYPVCPALTMLFSNDNTNGLIISRKLGSVK